MISLKIKFPLTREIYFYFVPEQKVLFYIYVLKKKEGKYSKVNNVKHFHSLNVSNKYT